ncbi:MAG: hypothetical protein N4A38_01555 [Candidatus Gracilibacteria bacterium]|nr:hypothetical protein [Candidatus Gracilibacteria bacterium]
MTKNIKKNLKEIGDNTPKMSKHYNTYLKNKVLSYANKEEKKNIFDINILFKLSSVALVFLIVFNVFFMGFSSDDFIAKAYEYHKEKSQNSITYQYIKEIYKRNENSKPQVTKTKEYFLNQKNLYIKEFDFGGDITQMFDGELFYSNNQYLDNKFYEIENIEEIKRKNRESKVEEKRALSIYDAVLDLSKTTGETALDYLETSDKLTFDKKVDNIAIYKITSGINVEEIHFDTKTYKIIKILSYYYNGNGERENILEKQIQTEYINKTEEEKIFDYQKYNLKPTNIIYKKRAK